MLNLPEYTILSIESEQLISNSYHGYSNLDKDKKPLLFKIIKDLYNTPENIARFKSVYGAIINIKSDRIIKIFDIQNSNEGIVLIKEDFNGISLKEFLEYEVFNPKSFLSIAIQLSEALEEMHSHNIYHGNISLSSIFLDKENNSIKIGDFGLSFLESRELESFYDRDVIENKLPFISPEQTGRMNRSVDYRTDFYSLGIVFYTLLTGIFPFSSRDPLELIHAHIAKMPKTPLEVKQDISEMVSAIIMKLLSKGAEERYQNVVGLKTDLKECERQLNEKGKIEEFPLGQKDISDKFNMSEKLYGREKEIEALLTAFERVCNGKSEVLLITGDPGIGKSALINEIHKMIIHQKSYFISGKHDQFTKNIPYNGIISAFQGLVKILLMEGESKLHAWKDKILNALGNNGKLITDVIPEVELIIGKQTVIPDLDPIQSQDRFNLFFKRFTEVFIDVEHPLVLFLDDLQWMDAASINLIKLLIANANNGYFLFIGAFRQNELKENNPQIIEFENMKKANVTINSIFLSRLDTVSINKLLSDTLFCPEEITKPLTQLIYDKTEGNPFFLKQFLMNLYEEHIVTFDVNYGWQWDIEKIKETHVTYNVVELMRGRIGKLLKLNLEVLEAASCIGNRFDKEVIISLFNDSDTKDEIYKAFTEIESEGFILISGNQYQFAHNRIRETAYNLISDERKIEMHYRIGRVILEQIRSGEQLNEKAFAAVDQLNRAIPMIHSPQEKQELALLNLQVGQKAKVSIAFESANTYFKAGMRLLGIDSWKSQYELTYSLYKERMECEYLTLNFTEAEIIFKEIIDNAKTNYEKANAYILIILLYGNMAQYKESLVKGIEAMKLIGSKVPEHVTKRMIVSKLLQLYVQFKKAKIKIEDIIDIPATTNPYADTWHLLAISIGTVVYYYDTNIWTYIITEGVFNILKYGNYEYSGLTFGLFGSILGSGLGFYKQGYRFGLLGLKANEKFASKKSIGLSIWSFAGFVQHWMEHAKYSLDNFREAYKSCLETGNLIFAHHAINQLCATRIILGDNIDEIIEEHESYRNFQIGSKDPFVVLNYRVNIQTLLCLKGRTDARGKLNTKDFDEEKVMVHYHESGALLGVSLLLLVKLKIHYLFREYAECVPIFAELYQLIYIKEIGKGYIHTTEANFYSSLSIAAWYPQAKRKNHRKYMRMIKRNQKQMKLWSGNCPENFLHKYLIIEAELAGIKGQIKKAKKYYDRAIQSARENGYKQNEAIANERASLLLQKKNDLENANIYMTEAHTCYTKWGATAKAKDLEEKYPHLLKAETIGAVPSLMSLDLSTIIKASQAISQEIEREKLLNKLMNIVVENAGAQKGFLILEHDGNLFVEAEGVLGEKEKGGFQVIPVSESQKLSPAIIQFVKRTKENIVLRNASEEGLFVSDPYISKNRIKSILCTPVFRQSELACILYLENNLLTDTFTPERLEVLNLLSSQAAISLENARLYDEMKKLNEELELRVAERTAELFKTNKRLKEEIIERKKGEKDLRLFTEKLERSNTELEQFAYIASHDLREPLRKINSFAEMLKKKYYSNLEEVGRDYLDRMQNASVRMQALIDDLLIYSRVSTQAVPCSSVNIDQVVNDVLSDLELQIKKTFTRVEADPLPVIEADPIQMRQLFQNLIANAIKFHRPDVPPVIRIYVLEEAPKGYCMLAVEDNGIGIEEQNYEKIFKMFGRLHGRDETEGSGIGLAVCKKITERHKGSIQVKSIPEEGTKFIITLPLNPDLTE